MLTDKLDLRSGPTPWQDDAWNRPVADPMPPDCDVAIIGAGISGAIMAERLSADGHAVVLLDRRPPGMGSTAASTAQIMWAMDVPFTELAASLGEDEAARRWRLVHASVSRFGDRIEDLGLDRLKRDCPTVYLNGPLLDPEGLRREGEVHLKNGLPSNFLKGQAVAERFGIAPRDALVLGDGFAIEPVRLAHGLLEAARERGARICYPFDAIGLEERKNGIAISLAEGQELRAKSVVLTTGYERADLFLPRNFKLLSTFVIATPPRTAPLWREEAMIWEAADPYLYVRSDPDGRVLVGGEDEDLCDPLRRDELIGTKAGTIAAKAASLLGSEPLKIDRAWAATFGSSPDGLPAIGRAANMTKVWLAAGYGGNGIAFAALAAELLSGALVGRAETDLACFAPYRFGSDR